MILDKENTFLDAKALSASTITSNVIYTGPGDSGCPMFLALQVSKDAGTGTLETVLETSADEAFTSVVTLGTYQAVPLSTPLPRGNLGYLRLKVTSTYTKGTVTAGLVLDDDIHHAVK